MNSDLLLAGWVACAGLGAAVGSRRCAALAGGLLGLLFGPLGVLAALAVDQRPRCPCCRERIERFAEVCRHCRSGLGWRRHWFHGPLAQRA